MREVDIPGSQDGVEKGDTNEPKSGQCDVCSVSCPTRFLQFCFPLANRFDDLCSKRGTRRNHRRKNDENEGQCNVWSMESIAPTLCINSVFKEQQECSSKSEEIRCNTKTHSSTAKKVTRFTERFGYGVDFISLGSCFKCNL